MISSPGHITNPYSINDDLTGNLYCGVQFNWDCDNQMVDISMPGYIQKNYRNMGISLARRHTQTKTVWHRSPSTPPPQRICKAGHKGNQTCPTNHWKYIMLCMGCQHDCVESSQLDCWRTNKSNCQNNGMMHTIIGLLIAQHKLKN